MRPRHRPLLCAATLVAGCGSDDEQAAPAGEGTPEQDGDGYSY